MKNELYNAMKAYCEENQCWGFKYSAKDWNAKLGTSFSPAAFTSAVKAGLMKKSKGHRQTIYSYGLASTPEMLQK